MFWLDYTVESVGLHGQGFRVKGEWPGEVMGEHKMVHLRIIGCINPVMFLLLTKMVGYVKLINLQH